MRAVGFHSEPAISGSAPDSSSHSFGNPDRLPARAEIELYCRRNDHQLINWYEPSEDESVNDFDARHDRFQQMIASFTGANARLALVIVPDASHLAEDLETLVDRLLVLDKLGKEVRCTDSNRPDALQSGEELLGVGGKSVQRQARIREAIISKASRGEVLGRTPFGYEAGTDGLLTPVPEEAATVREIFETYAGPWHAEDSEPLGGPGMRAIARSLNDRGSRTRSGRPWSALAISGILKNRTYLGTYNRYGVRIAGSHEPLVDREIFNRAEAVTRKRKPLRKRPTEPPYLVGGLARCEVCGRGLAGLTRRRTWKRGDGTAQSKSYRYYQCPSRNARAERSEEQLQHGFWHAEELEDAVRTEIARWGKRVKNKLKPETGESRAEEIAEAEREFTRAVRMVASAYGRLADLEQPLRHLISTRGKEDYEAPDPEFIEDLVNRALSDDIIQSKAAIGALVKRVELTGDTVEVLPFTR